MNTRRSPRNQEILWRSLGQQAVIAPASPASPSRCWDCRHYPKGGRSRGTCVLHGQMVAGLTEGKPCFAPRPEWRKGVR